MNERVCGHSDPRSCDLACRIEELEARAAAPSPALTREALPDESHFVALATAVLSVRDFLALHRKATGRSDVNIRKVLALLDDALSEVPAPSSTREETP